jgi:hypothetical protein
MTPFNDPKVAAVFDGFPHDCQHHMRAVREVIFDIANSDPRIGPLEETLKWGQPSYLTSTTKSGSTIRLAVPKSGGYGIYTHCQTTIMSDFQSVFSDLTYDGNRGILFKADEPPPLDALRPLIKSALTYHLKS